MRRRVRLTESDLNRIVKESVNSVLKEGESFFWNSSNQHLKPSVMDNQTKKFKEANNALQSIVPTIMSALDCFEYEEEHPETYKELSQINRSILRLKGLLRGDDMSYYGDANDD